MQVTAIKIDSSHSVIGENKRNKNNFSISKMPQSLNNSSSVPFKGKQGFFEAVANRWKKFLQDVKNDMNRPRNPDDSSGGHIHNHDDSRYEDDMRNL